MAVWVINGTKLFGTPLGSSPIKALSCAPIGLKYLSETILIAFVWAISCVLSLFMTGLFNQLLKHLSIFKLPGDIYVLSDLSLDLHPEAIGLVFILALVWVMIISFITFGRFKKSSVAQNLRKEFS